MYIFLHVIYKLFSKILHWIKIYSYVEIRSLEYRKVGLLSIALGSY